VAKREHVLWLIENAPKSKMLAVVGSELDSDMDPEAYPKGKALWLAHLEKNPEDLSILGNAAEFFFHADKDLAEESLLKAISLDPENPVWPKELGFLYWLGRRSDSAKESKKMAGKALEQYEIAYDLTADNKERSYLLQDLAENAYEAGEIEKADQFARDMLSCDIEDWNTGNNMHHGNIILGKIALQSGEIKKAAEHLIQAGAISGSPQLDSFGPDMTLAEALLEAGESDAVLEYFDYCSRFWELANGCLDIWSDSVEKGETPEFENCRMFGPDWENILEECE
jgi:tetratricopeptide (TPR) repeat protein